MLLLPPYTKFSGVSGIMFKLKELLVALSLMLLSVLFNPLFAESVTQKIASLGLTAQADYHKGDANKPAILIVHGFLTTNQFHTIRSIVKSFKDEGYTVLAPTLTLGINLREQSLKCNSIHTHTLEDDVTEIEEWVKWLEAQGQKEIVAIGHSSGSQEVLAMLKKNQHPSIKLAIFTSLFYMNGPELGTLTSDLDYAKRALDTDNHKPHKYSFLFCNNDYYSTPQSFLSYQKITRQYVLDELRSLTIPHYTIMGDADKRYQNVGLNWLDELKQTGTNLITVEGANHFFSREYEFDLQDHLLKSVLNYTTQQ